MKKNYICYFLLDEKITKTFYINKQRQIQFKIEGKVP